MRHEKDNVGAVYFNSAPELEGITFTGDLRPYVDVVFVDLNDKGHQYTCELRMLC